MFVLQLYSVFVTTGGLSCKVPSGWCFRSGCLLLGRYTTHIRQQVPLAVGYPLLHVVYNDGDDAHHPSIAIPCFIQAQVIHNTMGVAGGQRETNGRGVPAVQPWAPPSDPPWKSRRAQPATSQNQRSMDRIARGSMSPAKNHPGTDLEVLERTYIHLPCRNWLCAEEEQEEGAGNLPEHCMDLRAFTCPAMHQKKGWTNKPAFSLWMDTGSVSPTAGTVRQDLVPSLKPGRCWDRTGGEARWECAVLVPQHRQSDPRSWAEEAPTWLGWQWGRCCR